MSKALLQHGALMSCVTHGKAQTYRKPAWPSNQCAVCWLVALADQLMTPLYKDDIEAILERSKFTTKIEYEEVRDADV